MNLLEHLRIETGSGDLFPAHIGCENCMTSSLKNMHKKLIRKLQCVLLKFVQLITVTRSEYFFIYKFLLYLMSYQITKQIVKANGETVFSATLTVTNKFGEVRILAFVATKSHAQFESALAKMKDSLTLYGHKQPRIFYTDNPLADKQFLEKMFPSLLKDVVPVEKYTGLKAVILPDDMIISVQSTALGIDSALARVIDDIDTVNENNHIVIGFDAEWNVDLIHGGAPQPTAIIQIAYKKYINILQVLFYLFELFVFDIDLIYNQDQPI